VSRHVPSAGDESRMGITYVLVMVCQAAATVALWWFGRTFSR
jgi:hypothetical protein